MSCLQSVGPDRRFQYTSVGQTKEIAQEIMRLLLSVREIFINPERTGNTNTPLNLIFQKIGFAQQMGCTVGKNLTWLWIEVRGPHNTNGHRSLPTRVAVLIASFILSHCFLWDKPMNSNTDKLSTAQHWRIWIIVSRLKGLKWTSWIVDVSARRQGSHQSLSIFWCLVFAFWDGRMKLSVYLADKCAKRYKGQ